VPKITHTIPRRARNDCRRGSTLALSSRDASSQSRVFPGSHHRDVGALRLEGWFRQVLPGLTRRITVWGSAERCGEAVGRIIAHCARLLIFNPVLNEAEQLDRVGSERVPTLASA
jgi:hypothetical protein